MPNSAYQDRDALLGEVLLFGLLGKILYQYPENEQKAWFQSLIDSEAFSELPITASSVDITTGLELLQKWAQTGITDPVYAEMQGDHLRLFIGPGKVIAPPWESVFFSEARQTFQEQTLQVRGWYRRFGLEPEKIYHEPDDHIGLEMIFLSNLGSKALEALEQGEEQEFESLVAARKQFLTEHLLKWAFSWCDLVTKNARTDFYRGIAFLTRGTLAHMAELYSLEVPIQVTA